LNNFTEKANFIWSIADLIRDTFKRGRYQDVILPLLNPVKSYRLHFNKSLEKSYHPR
jgi:hypothetical protein